MARMWMPVFASGSLAQARFALGSSTVVPRAKYACTRLSCARPQYGGQRQVQEAQPAATLSAGALPSEHGDRAEIEALNLDLHPPRGAAEVEQLGGCEEGVDAGGQVGVGGRLAADPATDRRYRAFQVCAVEPSHGRARRFYELQEHQATA